MNKFTKCVMGLVLVALCFSMVACKKAYQEQGQQAQAQGKSPIGTSEQMAIASYLGTPGVVGDNIVGSLWGVDVQVELVDLTQKKVYFSTEQIPYDRVDQLCMDTSTVVYEVDGSLDGYTMRGERKLFGVPIDQLRAEKGRCAVVKYADGIEYSVSVEEMSQSLDYKYSYGGKMYMPDEGKLAVNFGGFISPEGVPSLTKLVTDLSVDGRVTQQRLLDFVTNYIKYDDTEKQRSRQVVKRPVETLLAGKATCASLAVLYASLLEQTGFTDYWIVYYPTHAAIYIKSDGGAHNSYSLKIGDSNYDYVETTCPGFVIGETRLKSSFDPTKFSVLYRPVDDYGISRDGTTFHLRE